MVYHYYCMPYKMCCTDNSEKITLTERKHVKTSARYLDSIEFNRIHTEFPTIMSREPYECIEFPTN